MPNLPPYLELPVTSGCVDCSGLNSDILSSAVTESADFSNKRTVFFWICLSLVLGNDKQESKQAVSFLQPVSTQQWPPVRKCFPWRVMRCSLVFFTYYKCCLFSAPFLFFNLFCWVTAVLWQQCELLSSRWQQIHSYFSRDQIMGIQIFSVIVCGRATAWWPVQGVSPPPPSPNT